MGIKGDIWEKPNMHPTFFKYLFFSLLLLVNNFLPAQNYTLSNWTIDNGLSCNDATDLFQDEDGFMWIATEHGLNKFDGYSFQNFRYQPGDSTSIGANYINSIFEDEKGNTWVNLAVGILAKYDKQTKKFTNYTFPNRKTFINQVKHVSGIGIVAATNRGLFTIDSSSARLHLLFPKGEHRDKRIFKILPATKQRLYLSTNTGFELLNTTSGLLTPALITYPSDTTSFTFPVGKLYEDVSGIIWIQTVYGSLYRSKDGLHFKKLIHGTGNPQIKPTRQLFLFQDKERTKWYFSNERQLLKCNDQTNYWERPSLITESASFAFLDRTENIWRFTNKHQLQRWNGKQWETKVDLEEDLKFWEITQVFVDRENGIWFASRGKGIWRVYERKWALKKLSINELNITAMYSDQANFLWIGSHNQLYRYNVALGNLIPWSNERRGENPFYRTKINQISRSKEGRMWIGTDRGLVLLEETDKQYRHLKTEFFNNKYINLSAIRRLLQDSIGRMWIGTNKGVFMYESSTNQLFHYSSSQAELPTIRSNDVQCLTQVSANQFLIGYVKEGVDFCTYDTLNHTLFCQKVSYHYIESEQDDFMTANTFLNTGTDFWLGTFSKGLLKINLDSLTMSPISKNFPIIPNIKAIQKGRNDDLWISSINGLTNVYPKDQSFYSFSKASGLGSSKFQQHCSTEDNFGNLYFGNTTGIIEIKSACWQQQDTLATPVLTDFRVFDESLTFSKPLDDLENINLRSQDEYITFEFVAPTYDNPEDVKYAYQLEGYDPYWKYCQGQPSVTYTDIPSGTYVFKVKAGNKGGFFDSTIKQVEIVVNPPFWKTSWFLFFILGLMGGAIWLMDKLHKKIRSNPIGMETTFSQVAIGEPFLEQPVFALSPREKEVLAELATGKSYRKIGESLFISEDTVRAHIRNIYRKMEVNSKASAVAKAVKFKLI